MARGYYDGFSRFVPLGAPVVMDAGAEHYRGYVIAPFSGGNFSTSVQVTNIATGAGQGTFASPSVAKRYIDKLLTGKNK